jgi:hypothetical protein
MAAIALQKAPNLSLGGPLARLSHPVEKPSQ